MADWKKSCEAIRSLLWDDLAPGTAASLLRPLIQHEWETPVRTSKAPELLQRVWDDIAWRRFDNHNPETLRLLGVHMLYRAAASLTDPDEAGTSLLLMRLAWEGIRDSLLELFARPEIAEVQIPSDLYTLQELLGFGWERRLSYGGKAN